MKIMNTEGARLTLPLELVAKLCGIQPQLLRDWCALKVIKPAAPGGKGRGRCHRFSAGQAIGIAIAGALYTAMGCRGSYITETYNDADSKLSDEEIERWVHGELTPWEEETRAADKARHPITVLPGQGKMLADMCSRIDNVLAYLRARGRVANRVAPKMGRKRM